jgi:hypothetical protein
MLLPMTGAFILLRSLLNGGAVDVSVIAWGRLPKTTVTNATQVTPRNGYDLVLREDGTLITVPGVFF